MTCPPYSVLRIGNSCPDDTERPLQSLFTRDSPLDQRYCSLLTLNRAEFLRTVGTVIIGVVACVFNPQEFEMLHCHSLTPFFEGQSVLS